MNTSTKNHLGELKNAYEKASYVKIILKSKKEHQGHILRGPEGETWFIATTQSNIQNTSATVEVSFELRDVQEIEILD